MNKKRTMLKAAAAGAVCIFTGTIPGLSAWAAQSLRVRRCVNTMKDGDPDLETYRDFVGIMLAKPQTDAVSWLGFANQHGDDKDFKFCPHGDWYFLPWHREFILMYERAAAALTKNDKFAMPYWDWTALPEYPPAFAAPAYKGKPNPLFVEGRNVLAGDYALTEDIVGQPVIDAIYRETEFEAFGTSRNPDQDSTDPKWVPAGGGYQGVLEHTPHNLVHNAIGAFMPESNSPRDPIFFMHHGNIDRIWASWNAMGRANSDDPMWLDMTFTDNYIAPDGTAYSRTVKDLLDTAPLGYTYDRMPPRKLRAAAATQRDARMRALFDRKATAKPRRIAKENSAPATPGSPLAIPFTLGQAALRGAARPESGKPASEVVALISRIRVTDAVKEIRVLVNHPAPSAKVPVSDAHFAGSIAFLKHSSGAHGHRKAPPSAIVNLTETLRRLGASAKGDQLTVQMVAVPKPGTAQAEAAKVVPAVVEIAVL